MKTSLRKLFLLVIAFSPCLSVRAELHQVTALNATTTKQIMIVGNKVLVIIFQNIGANAINASIDGGSSMGGQDPGTGATANALVIPAAVNGVPGTVVLYGPVFQGMIIVGLTQASTTTLNIITNAPLGSSTFPTN